MRHTRAALLVAATLAAAPLAACSNAVPDPTPVAEALAAGLADGDLEAVPFAGTTAGQASEDLAEVVSGMGGATRRVEVVEVEQVAGPDGSRQAVVDLAFSWDLDGPGPVEPGWSHPGQATLVLDEEAGAWQVRWSRSLVHPDLGADETLVLERVQPPRAEVLGTGGTPLVVDRDVERVGLDKVRLGDADADASARALADAVGVDAEAYAETVAAAGDEAFVEAVVLRSTDAEAVRGAVEAIPGGRLVPDTLPLAPTREFARALLGTVGEATAEVVEASDGAVAAGDLVGLSGLQAAYDEQLRGLPGFTVRTRDPDGARGDALVSSGPVAGTPLQLTLDPRLQQAADDVLADTGPPSALVALRPSDGQALAVASGPGGGGYSTATLGRYPPGSVFKVVTSLALLRAGLTEQSTLPCPPQVDVDGKVFGNYSGYPPGSIGDIPLVEAFAQSCNTAFVSQVDVVDADALAAAAASLAVGGWPDIGVEAFAGSVGDPGTRVDRAATLIGQGEVLVSPLAAAAMAASATGRTVVPWLVGDVRPAGTDAAPVEVGESASLLGMMRAAVTSGTAGVLAGVPGGPVVAKTGTAEFGAGTPPDTHGWMVAVQGDLAVAVFVESEASGAQTAGPILASFLTAAATTG